MSARPLKPVQEEQKDEQGNTVVVMPASPDGSKVDDAISAEDAERAAGIVASTLGRDSAKANLDLVARRTAPLTTEGLNNAYLRSPYAQQISAMQAKAASNSANTFTPQQWSPYTRAQFGQPYSHSFLYHFGIALGRSGKVMRRNAGFWGPRVFQAIFLGLHLRRPVLPGGPQQLPGQAGADPVRHGFYRLCQRG